MNASLSWHAAARKDRHDLRRIAHIGLAVREGPDLRYYEFFAGGGLARLGLGAEWQCLFANDISPLKARAYRAAFGGAVLRQGDIAQVTPNDLPGRADLAWASFPCQDLSLAGPRAGLAGARSGLFWDFWRLILALDQQNRGPGLIAIENVRGLLTSRGGADFAALIEALAASGRCVGALELCASHFTPQSRPRVFIIAAHTPKPCLIDSDPSPIWHTPDLRAAVQNLPLLARRHWVWWRLAIPPRRNTALADILLADDALGMAWDRPEKTQHLLSLLAPRVRQEVADQARSSAIRVGAVFRRTRRDGAGASVQRCEVRFDGLAGCLRTPRGGSSRQGLLIIDGARMRSRLLHPRECARLMGVSDAHPLPERPSAALSLLGDGVAVPVVDWLQAHLLTPLARGAGLTLT